MNDYSTMTIREIAIEIKKDWKNVWFGAVPYLEAMMDVEKLGDDFIFEDGDTQVIYFLANAQTWKGETAKAIKAELNKRHKQYEKGMDV